MFWKISFLLFAILSVGKAEAKLKGQLLERGTRRPLANVNVFILPQKLKSVTDEKGRFEFEAEVQENSEVIVNKAGYIRLKRKLERPEALLLYLEREEYEVFETVVTGVKEKKDVSKKSLDQSQFLKAPGAQEDPVKAVQNLPGVANQAFSSQIVIQGSAPDDTRYTLNGHEIPLVFHFAGLTSVVPPRAIGSVDYLASGYGPEYGRALGGIINLNTRAPKEDRWHGEAFVDITKLGALTEGPVSEDSGLFISGRVSYIGKLLESAADNMDEFEITAAPEFQDFFIEYDKELSASETLSFSTIRSQDTLGLVLKDGDDPGFLGSLSQKTTFYRFIPRYRKKIGSRGELDLSLAYGEDDIFVSVGDKFFDLDSTVFSQRANYNYKQSSSYSYDVGVDSIYRDTTAGIRLPNFNNQGGVGAAGGEDIIANIETKTWESAVYWRNTIELTEKATLSPNLRAEHFSLIDKTYIMPRVSGTYNIDKSLDFVAAAGLYYQAPQNGEATEEFGNPDLEAEKAIHTYAGIVKDFREGSNQGGTLEFGVFYKKLDDLIIQSSEQNDDGSAERYNNDGEGDITGSQVLGTYTYKKYAFSLAYTYLVSTRKEPGREEYPSEFDQTHNLNFIAAYELERWTFATRLRYVSGSPYTPVTGSVFDSDRDLYQPVRGKFYSERFDDFFQLDFRIDRKWIYDTWILSAYLDIQNLTNAENGQNISYNYDFSESDTARGLPILPILGVRGEF